MCWVKTNTDDIWTKQKPTAWLKTEHDTETDRFSDLTIIRTDVCISLIFKQFYLLL